MLPNSKSSARVQRSFQRENLQLLHDLKKRNRELKVQEIISAGHELTAEENLRAATVSRITKERSRSQPSSPSLQKSSPKNEEKIPVQNVPHFGSIPKYLVRVKAELAKKRVQRMHSEEDRQMKLSYPNGKVPLQQRAREVAEVFWHERVAELSSALSRFPFSASSHHSQKKKSDVELKLKEAQVELDKYEYSTVFVASCQPHLVLK